MKVSRKRPKGPTDAERATTAKARLSGLEKALPSLCEAALALEGVPELPATDKAAPDRDGEDLAVLAEEVLDVYARVKELRDRLALPLDLTKH